MTLFENAQAEPGEYDEYSALPGRLPGEGENRLGMKVLLHG
jgi:hypothetical protein